jgi:hypothetical protein
MLQDLVKAYCHNTVMQCFSTWGTPNQGGIRVGLGGTPNFKFYS